MLADNTIYMKKNFMNLYQNFVNWEENHTSDGFLIESTRNNDRTIKYNKDGYDLYLHSKYDPRREAKSIIDRVSEQEKIDDQTHVVFYGVGLGYHIDEFVSRFPKTEFSIFEPSLEVLSLFLNNIDLNRNTYKKLKQFESNIGLNPELRLFDKLSIDYKKSIVILDLPIYRTIFKDQYKVFLTKVKELTKLKRGSFATSYAHRKRWIHNSLMNIREIIKTPNIIMQNRDVFVDKTAILVAAGPSLNFEIEHLKQIKEQGMAVIFSVGSAINTLIDNDILPDAICTFDPTVNNQIVFKKMNQNNIKSIPMIFGSSIGYEVLQQYNGPKLHMITERDTISKYFLKSRITGELETVNDAPSVAALTLELLSKLKFSKVVLVGQNLAYLKDLHYADGIDYRKPVKVEEQTGTFEIEDVNGNPVNTTNGFFAMKKQIEHYIRFYKINAINTTIGGAKIEGAEFVPMCEVIKELNDSKEIAGDIFVSIKSESLYDMDYIKSQLQKFNDQFETYNELLHILKRHLEKLGSLVNNRNYKQASAMHKKLDAFLEKLEANDFFKVIAQPLNRTEFEILAKNVQLSKEENDEINKLKFLLPHFETFINILYLERQSNEKILNEINEAYQQEYEDN